MFAISSNHYSVDDQISDAVSWLSQNESTAEFMNTAFLAEFPEYNALEWSGSWVDTEASGVDPEYMSWVADWLESHTDVYWEEGEPWVREAMDTEDV